MEENDGSLDSLFLHPLNQGLDARTLPVVGIDRLSHRQVSEIACHAQGPYLARLCRGSVTVVRRSEVGGGMSRHRLDQPGGCIQFQFDLFITRLRKVLVRIAVIADFMSFPGNALEKVRVLLHLRSKNKECGGSLFLLKDLEDLRGPLGIGTIIEGDRNHVLARISLPYDVFRHREAGVSVQKFPGGLLRHRPLSLTRVFTDRNKIAASCRGNLLVEVQLSEFFQFLRVQRVREIFFQQIPHSGILLAETIKPDSPGVIRGYLPKLICKGDGIEKPDLVLLILIKPAEIAEMGRVIFRDHIDSIHARRRRACHGVGESNGFDRHGILSPIIGIAPQADHPLIGLPVHHHRFQPSLKPIATGKRPRISGFGIFIVECSHHPVARFCDLLEIKNVEIISGGNGKPEFTAISMKSLCNFADEFGDFLFVRGIQFTPLY